MASYQITYFFAIPMSSVTLVVVTALCSAPLIVGGLSVFIFKERITTRLVLAIGLGLVGTVLLAFGGSQGTVFKWEYALGALLALATGFSYAIMVIFSKLASNAATGDRDRGPIQPIAVAFTIAAVVLLPVAIFTGSFRLDLAWGVWGISAYLGLIPTGLAYIIFFRAIAHTSATVASVISMLEPCVAAFLAWLLLGEQLTILSLTGSVLLLASVLILSNRQ
jgi:DME family drug/metabolite transporter